MQPHPTYNTKQLAILGDKPAFSAPLHVGRPNIGSRAQFMAYAAQMFDNRWLSNHGPLVKQFEAELAQFLGVKHCITVCNATVGLELAIRALGMQGEVILPSFTFIATAHALQWQDITPVFADIDPHTHTIDPNAIARLITPRTSGIIGVHLWGQPCQTDALAEIARTHGLKLLYDAAHAFGVSHQDKMIGNFGDAEVFSFHATKFFNTFEGGAITTNDDALAERIRLMENFGFAGYDNVIYIGTNGKMNEACAAMGLTNLQALDEFIEINQRNYTQYQRELADMPGIRMITYPGDARRNFQYIVLEVDETVTGIARDALLATLHAENVLARRYFYPGCHRMEPYRSYFPNSGLLLPNTEQIAARVLILPTGSAVHPTDIEIIADILRAALARADEIRLALANHANA